MAKSNLTLSCSFAWWLKPYLLLLVWFCWLTRNEPDEEALSRMISRAMRIKVVNK